MAVEQGYEIFDTTAAQLHDDVWGLALALNATMTMVNENNITGTGCENLTGNLVPLEEFTYNNTKFIDLESDCQTSLVYRYVCINDSTLRRCLLNTLT